MNRRTFLTGTGLAATAGLIAACRGEPDVEPGIKPEAPPSRGEDSSQAQDWAWVRSQFALRPDQIHLSALLVASHPRCVREAIDQFRRNLNEDPVAYLERENNRRKREVRVEAAKYLGVDADDVALTDSTTMGLGLVYNGFRLHPGQEMLTTEHAYYATHESLRVAAARTGATLRKVVLVERPETTTEEEIVARIVQALRSNTRVLALTWVHSSTGLKLPMHAIHEAVNEINAERDEEDRILLCLDGVHGLGVEDVAMDDLGCDFFMAGCHKWLFGPRGTGIVWGRPEAWAATRPTIPSFMDDASWTAWGTEEDPAGPTNATRMSPGGFKAFEHQWAAEAFRFHQQIGKARVAERTHTLNRQLKEGLDAMPHVALYTPLSERLSAGIVCFGIEGWSPEDVVSRLRKQNIIATTTPYAVSYARLTPSIINTPEEIDTALRAVHELA